jgi:hypothetical protein
MATVGDRVQVPTRKVGETPREGVVTEVAGLMLRVRWSTGEESSFVPSMGSITVLGKVRASPRAAGPGSQVPQAGMEKKLTAAPARRPSPAKQAEKVSKDPGKATKAAGKTTKAAGKTSRSAGAPGGKTAAKTNRTVQKTSRTVQKTSRSAGAPGGKTAAKTNRTIGSLGGKTAGAKQSGKTTKLAAPKKAARSTTATARPKPGKHN